MHAPENNIGAFYANGFGVARNREKALYWLRRAESDSDDDSPQWRVIHANLTRVRSNDYAGAKKYSQPLQLAQNTRRVAQAITPKKKSQAAKAPPPPTNKPRKK
jgi:TPR repeat protein